VVCRSGVVIVVSLPPPSFSTYPPREQLLTAVVRRVVGSALFPILDLVRSPLPSFFLLLLLLLLVPSSLASAPPVRRASFLVPLSFLVGCSTRYPPHEQQLAAVA
jgi:hypothetical protein